MGISVLELMDKGMTYEEAVNFQLKFFAIMGSIVLILYIIKITTKRYCPRVYEKLKKHNVF